MGNNFEEKLGTILGFFAGWLIVSFMSNLVFQLVIFIFDVKINFWLSFLALALVIFVARIKELFEWLKEIDFRENNNQKTLEKEILDYKEKLKEEMLKQGAKESDLELIKEETIKNAIKENREPKDVAWALLQ